MTPKKSKSRARKPVQAAEPLEAALQAPSGEVSGKSGALAWGLVLGGITVMSAIAPWGFPNRPMWSLAWYLIGLACVFSGFAWMPRHESAVKDPYFGGRTALLLLLAAFYQGGWGFFLQLHLMFIVGAGVLWVYLSGQTLGGEREGQLKTPAWALATLLVLTVAGGWLRCHDVMSVPNGVHMDEIGTFDNFERAYSRNINVFFGIYDNLCASGTLLGQGVAVFASQILAKFGFHGLENLRLGQAIFGTMIIPVFFLLMRLFFGWSAALWAVLFLAFSRYGIAGSRHMVYDSPRIFFECIIFWAFWRGIRGSWLWFVPAGLLTGLALYGCHYNQYIIPMLLVAYLFLAVYIKKVPLAKGTMALILILGLAWIVFLPMWHAIQTYGVGGFMVRANEIKVAPSHDNVFYTNIMLNIKQYLHQYTDAGALYTILGLSKEPMLDPWAGLLMFLGLAGAAAAWQRGKMEAAFCVGWFLAGLAPGIFSDIIPVPYRISLQTPVLFGFAGMAADQILRFPACKPSRLLKIAGGLMMLLFAFKSAFWSYQSYFVKYPADAQSRAALGGYLVDMAREIKAQPPSVEIVVSDSYNSGATNPVVLHYLSERSWRWSTTQWSTIFPGDFNAKGGAAIFQDATAELFYPTFKSLYPGSKMLLHVDLAHPSAFQGTASGETPGNPYCSIFVPQEDIMRTKGCHLELITKSGTKIFEGSGLQLPAEAEALRPIKAIWTGSVFIPARQGYQLRGQAPQGFRLQLEGHEWKIGQIQVFDEGMLPFRAELPMGDHAASDLALNLGGRTGEETVLLSSANSLRPASFSQGLRVNYYPAKAGAQAKPGGILFSEQGTPLVSRIEPTLFARWENVDIYRARPLVGAGLIIWKGWMQVPSAGKYLFAEEKGQLGLKVWIDGSLCLPIGPADKNRQGREIMLSKGRHAFKARYEAVPDPTTNSFTGPALMVTAPGAPATLLPMAWLEPD